MCQCQLTKSNFSSSCCCWRMKTFWSLQSSDFFTSVSDCLHIFRAFTSQKNASVWLRPNYVRRRNDNHADGDTHTDVLNLVAWSGWGVEGLWGNGPLGTNMSKSLRHVSATFSMQTRTHRHKKRLFHWILHLFAVVSFLICSHFASLSSVFSSLWGSFLFLFGHFAFHHSYFVFFVSL